ncbi:MAG: SOS response-associated peptidase [Gammaproteobacteria bacterium]|nr:SOS response-associated peptidase [Gammaproteobacteria bacterium]
MCGRFAFYSPSEATAALFGATGSVDLKPRYNIAPTQEIAAIRATEDHGRELTTLRWGLVPFWAKDPSIGNRMINARAETVAEKPAYRAAYRKRRCLVLADGFYEWKKEGSGKTPYLISLASGEPFALAGLWEHWQAKDADQSIDSATLITTDANAFMSQLHHRMPVVLEPETAERWMAGDEDLLDYVACHGPRLRAWPVDRRVNNARNEGAELIEPVGDSVVS